MTSLAATDPLALRVAAARRWCRTLGHSPVEKVGVTIVRTPAHPYLFEGNFIMATCGADPVRIVHALMDSARLGGCLVAYADCLTPPSAIAAFESGGLRAGSTLTELVASEIKVPEQAPDFSSQPAAGVLWPTLASLIEANYCEGKPVRAIDRDVAKGLVESARSRSTDCIYSLIRSDGQLAGYGMTAVCPNGLGLIEDLYIKPEARRRGIMSAFIHMAARHLKESGCDAVFVDALEGGRAAQLYQRLGFRPLARSTLFVPHST